MPLSYLTLPDSNVIAYHKHNGKQNGLSTPGIVFLGGFMSDMEGTKALALEHFCQENNLDFLRFDYFGHGKSSGKFEDGTIGLWKQNVLTVLDQLTQGPQILVGSSMGGWLMLLAALTRPERIKGLVGIASAPDFTENLLWDLFDDTIKHAIQSNGVYHLKSDYGDTPYPISRQLILEGRNHLLLKRPIPIYLPIRLLHGMKDDDVPFSLSIDLARQLKSDDVRIQLVKDGDHRMSTSQDVALLCTTVREMVGICTV